MIKGFDAAQEAYDRMLPDDYYDDDVDEDEGDFDEDDDRDFDDDRYDDDDDGFQEALQAYEDKIYNGGDR